MTVSPGDEEVDQDAIASEAEAETPVEPEASPRAQHQSSNLTRDYRLEKPSCEYLQIEREMQFDYYE